MNRFVFSGPMEEGLEVTLSPEESRHLATVLRLEAGERVGLVDGRGVTAVAEVTRPCPGGTRLRITSVTQNNELFRIHLVMGISKSEAMEFVLRRCVELGISGFQPVLTDHSLRPKSWNGSRWARIVLEVCKQCESAIFPEFREPLLLKRWISERRPDRRLVVCDEAKRGSRGTFTEKPMLDLVIGPEGGWSDQERVLFETSGALFLGLGAHRLRTETAALVATVLLKKELGEL